LPCAHEFLVIVQATRALTFAPGSGCGGQLQHCQDARHRKDSNQVPQSEGSVPLALTTQTVRFCCEHRSLRSVAAAAEAKYRLIYFRGDPVASDYLKAQKMPRSLKDYVGALAEITVGGPQTWPIR